MLYPQNGDRIVTVAVDYVTSLHAMYKVGGRTVAATWSGDYIELLQLLKLKIRTNLLWYNDDYDSSSICNAQTSPN